MERVDLRGESGESSESPGDSGAFEGRGRDALGLSRRKARGQDGLGLSRREVELLKGELRARGREEVWPGFWMREGPVGVVEVRERPDELEPEPEPGRPGEPEPEAEPEPDRLEEEDILRDVLGEPPIPRAAARISS